MSANRQQYAGFYQTNDEMKQVTKALVWSLIRIGLCVGVGKEDECNWPRQTFNPPCSFAAAAAGQRAEEEGSTKRGHPLRKATGKGMSSLMTELKRNS